MKSAEGGSWGTGFGVNHRSNLNTPRNSSRRHIKSRQGEEIDFTKTRELTTKEQVNNVPDPQQKGRKREICLKVKEEWVIDLRRGGAR